PVRARICVEHARIRRLVERGRTDEKRKQGDRQDQSGANDKVAPGQIRPKWLARLFQEVLIFLAIGFRVNRFTGGWRFRNTVAQDEPDMQADKGKHNARNYENVNGKKPAQGGAADRVASQDKVRQSSADPWNATGLFSRYHY